MPVLDPGICAVWCSKRTRAFTCLEEHEAWHASWIQAAVTRDEYMAFALKEKNDRARGL